MPIETDLTQPDGGDSLESTFMKCKLCWHKRCSDQFNSSLNGRKKDDHLNMSRQLVES